MVGCGNEVTMKLYVVPNLQPICWNVLTLTDVPFIAINHTFGPASATFS